MADEADSGGSSPHLALHINDIIKNMLSIRESRVSIPSVHVILPCPSSSSVLFRASERLHRLVAVSSLPAFNSPHVLPTSMSKT